MMGSFFFILNFLGVFFGPKKVNLNLTSHFQACYNNITIQNWNGFKKKKTPPDFKIGFHLTRLGGKVLASDD